MEQGIVIIGVSNIIYDMFDPEKNVRKREVAGDSTVLTDGVWVWPEVSLYYILKYNLKIPEDFTKHIIEKTSSQTKISIYQITVLT